MIKSVLPCISQFEGVLSVRLASRHGMSGADGRFCRGELLNGLPL